MGIHFDAPYEHGVMNYCDAQLEYGGEYILMYRMSIVLLMQSMSVGCNKVKNVS